MRHQPGELIDHYEILGSLGEGAYAETYKARDTASGDTVVLKMPNPNLFADPGLFQRNDSPFRGSSSHGNQRRRLPCSLDDTCGHWGPGQAVDYDSLRIPSPHELYCKIRIINLQRPLPNHDSIHGSAKQVDAPQVLRRREPRITIRGRYLSIEAHRGVQNDKRTSPRADPRQSRH